MLHMVHFGRFDNVYSIECSKINTPPSVEQCKLFILSIAMYVFIICWCISTNFRCAPKCGGVNRKKTASISKQEVATHTNSTLSIVDHIKFDHMIKF